jgi:hypothetical protein
MKNAFLFFSLLSLLSLSSKAQDEKQLVTRAVEDYVDAFYEGDTTKILRSISPNVVKYGYYRKKNETTYNGEPMSYREMLDYATSVGKKMKPGTVTPPSSVEVLDYQDQTAAAKVNAWWGTDYILLAKLNGKWMITHVLWQSPPIASK